MSLCCTHVTRCCNAVWRGGRPGDSKDNYATLRRMRLFFALLLPVFLACSCTSSLEGFECSRDLECEVAGVMGFCEGTGLCSFKDTDCASGRRYGSTAGELAGECVVGNTDGGAGTIDGGLALMLSGLEFTGISTLRPAFDPLVFFYELNVSFLESEIRVLATANSAATILVNALAVSAYAEDSQAIGINNDGLNNGALESGAVYVFRQTGDTWAQEAYVKASNTDVADHFGISLALHGDTLAVGAYLEDSGASGMSGNQGDNTATNGGAAYVFRRDGAVWSQAAYVKASNTDADDHFGFSIALSGDSLVVGAADEKSAAVGMNSDQADDSLIKAGAFYLYQ